MKKYQLTAKQLESVLRRLVEADRISGFKLHERSSLSDSWIIGAIVEVDQAIRELD